MNGNSNVDDYFDEYKAEDAARDAAETKAASGPVEHRKFPVGLTILRILPAPKGTGGKVFAEQWSHPNLPVQGGGRKEVFMLCARHHGGGVCKACEMFLKLSRSKNPADQELAKKYQPQRFVRLRAITRTMGDREVPVEAQRPEVWVLGQRMAEDFMALLDPSKAGSRPITHPLRGQDVWVTREGTGQFDTKYKVTLSADGPTPLTQTPEHLQAIVASMPELEVDTARRVPGVEVQVALMSGMDTKDAWRLGQGAAQHRGQMDAGYGGNRQQLPSGGGGYGSSPPPRSGGYAQPRSRQAPQGEVDDDGFPVGGGGGEDDNIPF